MGWISFPSMFKTYCWEDCIIELIEISIETPVFLQLCLIHQHPPGHPPWPWYQNIPTDQIQHPNWLNSISQLIEFYIPTDPIQYPNGSNSFPWVASDHGTSTTQSSARIPLRYIFRKSLQKLKKFNNFHKLIFQAQLSWTII